MHRSSSSYFFRSVIWLIILNILIKPAWVFIVDRTVQNETGQVAYGGYFSVLNLSLILSVFLDAGITGWYNRNLAHDRQQFLAAAGAILSARLFLSIIFILLLLVIASQGRIFDIELVIAIGLIQVTASFLLFFRSVITAEQWFMTDAWVSILDKTLLLLICVAWIWGPFPGKVSIQTFAWLQVAVTLVIALVALGILLFRRFSFRSRSRHWNFFGLLRAAWPYALLTLLMAAHFRSDGFLLSLLRPRQDPEAGIYASAYRLLDAANMIGVLVGGMAIPYLAKIHSGGQPLQPVVKRLQHLLIVFSIALTSLVFFQSRWIHQLLYTDSGPYEASVLKWCIASLVACSFVSIYGTVLTALGEIKTFCAIIGVSLGLNIGLNFWCIPSHGALGSAFAALASQSLAALLTIIFTWKKEKVAPGSRPALFYILLAGVICGYLYTGQYFLWSPWILVAGTALIALAALVITGGFHPASWKKMASSFKQ